MRQGLSPANGNLTHRAGRLPLVRSAAAAPMRPKRAAYAACLRAWAHGATESPQRSATVAAVALGGVALGEFSAA